MVLAAPAGAAPTAEGKQWRELYETTGLTRAQVATVCPTDGATTCQGSVGGRDLTGWVWATSEQVRGLMDDYAPVLATADPPVVSGIDGFFAAMGFLGDMRWTSFVSLTYFSSESTYGWTASTDPDGTPTGGGAAYSHALTGSTATGSLGLGSVVDTASAERGVFLWRDPDLDYTPPVVTPTVTGTLGDNGWYRSNVSVSWSVIDAQSALTATDGCADSVLAADSAGTTYTCTASSAPSAGPGSATVTVKRDVTAPTVACGVRPTFDYAQQPALVNATVADATSGAAAAVVSAAANTMVAGVGKVTVTGADRAGNRLSRACPYLVRPATCLGQAVTIRGTAGPDVLVGTAGVDVIHGYGGADRLDGVNGNDLICGGDGGDLVYGGNGADRVDGGAGSDDINGGAGDDNLAGGADADAIRGDDGADRCSSGEIRMSSCAFIY